MNRKVLLGLIGITVSISIIVTGCGSSKPKTPSSVPNVNVQKDPAKNTTGDDGKTPSNSIPKDGDKAVDKLVLAFKMEEIPEATNIDANTPWEASPSKALKATIMGKGETAEEEGDSYIIIKSLASDKLTKFILVGTGKQQLAAKDIEWVDENNLYVIIGAAYGTVSMGGQIYKLDITTGELSLAYGTKNSREEYMSIHRTEDGFKLKKHIYDDENLVKGHIEVIDKKDN